MKNKRRNRLFQAFGAAGVSILLAIAIWQSGMLTAWENKVWDTQSMMLASPSPRSEDITIVLVDQQSLEWAQKNMGISWPWPRELYGAILDTINRHQARGIGFDVLFTESSSFGVSDDAALGTAIAKSKNFAAGSVFPGNIHGKLSTWPDDIPLPSLATTATLVKKTDNTPSYNFLTMPIPEVAQNAAVLCNVHHDPDQDGIYRSLHPLVFAVGIPLPSLGLGLYLAAHPDTEVSLLNQHLSVGDAVIPMNISGQALVRFRGPPGIYTRISAATLIKDEMLYRDGEHTDPAINRQLRKKYVLFGFSAPGLFDLRPTPVGAIFSGVEINATFLDNLLNNDFISPLSQNLKILVLSFSTILLGLLLAYFSSPIYMTIIALFFLLIPPALSFFLFFIGFRFEILPFECSVGGTIILSFLISYMQEGRKRRFIKHSFAHYLSPYVIEQLIEDPDRLQLGGDRKELTIFFSDLEGFTSISENLEPDQLIELLNDYLSAMTDIILEEEGTIDKYEGDAIIAFWNAPLETPDHAVRAVSAALRCQKRLKELRPLFLKQCGHEMHMRIGINSGSAVVGNLGSTNRFDYSMLGDAVNLAARLEGANKQFDSYTMISESTYKLLNNTFFCRELANLTVVGKKIPIRVYEPFLPSEYQKKKKTLETFSKALQNFYIGNFESAVIQFNTIVDEDPSAIKYLNKCKVLQENPPPQWEGVWALTSK